MPSVNAENFAAWCLKNYDEGLEAHRNSPFIPTISVIHEFLRAMVNLGQAERGVVAYLSVMAGCYQESIVEIMPVLATLPGSRPMLAAYFSTLSESTDPERN